MQIYFPTQMEILTFYEAEPIILPNCYLKLGRAMSQIVVELNSFISPTNMNKIFSF